MKCIWVTAIPYLLEIMHVFGRVFLFVLGVTTIGCGGSSKPIHHPFPVIQHIESTPTLHSKGIGPVSALPLGSLNDSLVTEGKKQFRAYCISCHKPKAKFIGPALAGVLNRRSPEWIMNMMLNTSEMLKKDTVAYSLLQAYRNVPMTYSGITQQEARSVLEYLRTL